MNAANRGKTGSEIIEHDKSTAMRDSRSDGHFVTNEQTITVQKVMRRKEIVGRCAHTHVCGHFDPLLTFALRTFAPLENHHRCYLPYWLGPGLRVTGLLCRVTVGVIRVMD